jgi:hypothetical protein
MVDLGTVDPARLYMCTLDYMCVLVPNMGKTRVRSGTKKPGAKNIDHVWPSTTVEPINQA